MRFAWQSGSPSALALAVATLTVLAIAGCTHDRDASSTIPAAVTSEAAGPGAGPPFAPNGRTSDAAIDAVIEHLLRDDARSLRKRYGDAATYEWSKQPFPFPTDIRPSADEWTSRLGNARRSLYAVMRWVGQSPQRDASVILLVTPDGGESETWSLAVKDGNVIFVDLRWEDPGQVAARVAWMYEAYMVLPPAADLPKPPPARPLRLATGDGGVDRILELLAAADAAGLDGLVQYQNQECRLVSGVSCPADQSQSSLVRALPARSCSGPQVDLGAAQVRSQLQTMARGSPALHAVATLPAGYQPAGRHLIIVAAEVTRYNWGTFGIIEADGTIAGLVINCDKYPQQLYPPLAYIIPPAKDGAVLPVRAPGLPVIDDFIVALNSGDLDRLQQLIDFTLIPCEANPRGIGSPPQCAPGEPAGALIETLPTGSCEGTFMRKDDVPGYLRRLSGTAWAIFAIADLGPPSPSYRAGAAGNFDVVIVTGDAGGPPNSPLELSFSAAGLRTIRGPCGSGVRPDNMLSPGKSPSFLLPPP